MSWVDRIEEECRGAEDEKVCVVDKLMRKALELDNKFSFFKDFRIMKDLSKKFEGLTGEEFKKRFGEEYGRMKEKYDILSFMYDLHASGKKKTRDEEKVRKEPWNFVEERPEERTKFRVVGGKAIMEVDNVCRITGRVMAGPNGLIPEEPFIRKIEGDLDECYPIIKRDFETIFS